VAGLVSGLAAWLGGELAMNTFKPPRHAFNSKGVILQVTDRKEEATADARNAGLAFAILGAALGAGLGAAGGMVRRSGRGTATGALFGLVIGSVAVVAVSAAILPAFNAFKARDPDRASREILYPILVHAGIWSVAGAAGGLAFARGLRLKGLASTATVGGLVGAAIGAVAYDLIGMTLFPEAQTTGFISTTWQTRLLARLAVTLLASSGVALAVADPRSRRNNPPTAT
jgi:hypothetical protein